MTARMAAAADMTLSKLLSMAVGAGAGAVKPVTVTSGGRFGDTALRQLWVIVAVAFGLMRRMRIGRDCWPVMEGSVVLLLPLLMVEVLCFDRLIRDYMSLTGVSFLDGPLLFGRLSDSTAYEVEYSIECSGLSLVCDNLGGSTTPVCSTMRV